jgi:hypothetical protein
MSSGLKVKPIRFRAACEYIAANHRHHKPPQGWLFGIAAYEGERLCGVACVGRPVARKLDNGMTCEVTRLCTDGTRNVCSLLYAACWRAAEAMGYRKIVTYILGSETGASLRATGWKCEGEAGGGSWSCASRPRVDQAPTEVKTRWCREAA